MSGLQASFRPIGTDGSQRQNSQVSGDRRESGPLKEIVAQQDSLYKYISWEDPVRTIGSYFVAMGFLLAIHNLHLTQLALKASAFGLGVMSLAEFAGRSFGPDNFVSRLRPKEYKTVPESTLNATLKDIHDFIQYAVVQAQRILYAQDLDKTFGAFLFATSLYFLIQFMSPFGIAVLGLTSIYIIPLVTSPRGKDIARDGMVRAQELSNAAVDKGSSLAQDSKDTVSNLSSKAQGTAGDLRRRAGNMIPSGKQPTTDTRPEQVSDITSSVPNESSEPTQAKDISSKISQYTDNTLPTQSNSSPSIASRDTSSFEKLPQSSINDTDRSINDSTGFPQGASEGYAGQSQGITSTLSRGAADDFSSPTQHTSNFGQDNAEDLPIYAQNRQSHNYSQFPHVGGHDLGMRPESNTQNGGQSQGGVPSSIHDSNYSLQNRMDRDANYNDFVPRGQPNRGTQLGALTDTSSGRMPIGELIDQANRAGDSAPPLSAGGLNAMK